MAAKEPGHAGPGRNVSHEPVDTRAPESRLAGPGAWTARDICHLSGERRRVSQLTTHNLEIMIVTQQFPGPPPAPDVVKAGAENAGHRGEDQQQSEQRHQDQRHRVAVPDNVH